MLLNYLKLSFRLMSRNPFFTLINLLGLSTGFAVFLVLWQHSQHEIQSDQFHDDWQNIVRLTFQVDDLVFHGRVAGIHPAFEKRLAQTIPELSDYLRMCDQNQFRSLFTGDHGSDVSLTYTNPQGQKVSHPEYKLCYADDNLFNFFGIPLIVGNKNSALKRPTSIVLSEKLAQKYFGDSSPLDAVLLLNDSIPLAVTGVFKNIPSNSHLDFEAVISLSHVEKNLEETDFSHDAWFPVYFKLPTGTDREALTQKIEEAKVTFLTQEFDRFDWKPSDWRTDLQPLDKVAFQWAKGDNFTVKSKPVLYLFSITAIVILSMAWINYINLAIARNTKRLRELATRLTVGADSTQLLTQFCVEAVVVNVLSLLLAFTMIQVVRTPAESLLAISFPNWTNMSLLSTLIIAVVLVGGTLASALYPFLIAMKQSPRALFSQTSRTRNSNISVNTLTVVQLTFAMVLVIWVFGAYTQMDYILKRDLGFRKEEVVVVDFPFLQPSDFNSHKEAFKEDISIIGGVEGYTISSSVAGDNDPHALVLKRSTLSDLVAAGTNGGVDEKFLDFYDIHLLVGRNFLPEHPADHHAIIVSEKVVANLGFANPAEAIGRRVLVEHSEWTLDLRPVEIIGVIEDYERLPLIKEFQPFWSSDLGTALTYGDNVSKENRPRKISIKIRPELWAETLEQIEIVYQNHFHGSLFNWYLLDDHVNRHYLNEKLTRNQILLLSCLAIGITCLGFLGMISNKVAEKTKEIGIRKVLGAQLHEIAKVLLDTSLRQVLVAGVIGVPIASFVLRRYQEKFSDQVELHWWHYVSPAMILLTIMVLTIASTLWKAANGNPVEALKHE